MKIGKNQEKETLSAQSYDIRTPMNAIRGFVGIARKNLGDRERLVDCLDKIDRSCEQLLSLVGGTGEAAGVAAEVPGRPDEAPSFVGRRVLLVEDNELNREVAEFVLKEQGFEVESAEDGSVAVRRVREKGPTGFDYVLMDIQMPVMNGYEATKMIRGLGFTRPIVALSANAFAEDRERSLAAGMDEHVAKPIRVRELMSTLARLG